MKAEVKFPPIGATVSVPIEIDRPASTCIHDTANRPMCTIIPLAEKPDADSAGPWILSPWGNGPGIACFLEEWDGEPFFDVEIVEIMPKSVIARPLEPEYDDGASDPMSAERGLR